MDNSNDPLLSVASAYIASAVVTSSSVKVERFNGDAKYDVSHFDCGIDLFNKFLTSGKIYRELQRKISIPYVCLIVKEDGAKQVIGYFTLASGFLEKKLPPPPLNKQNRKFPYNTLPTIVVGKIAVCKSVQGQGLGKKLLSCAVKTAYLKSRNVDCSIVLFLKAFDQKAAGFYQRLGWIELENKGFFVYPLKLYKEFLKKSVV